jgi:hypothetical protein
VTAPAETPSPKEAAEARYLATPRAIRERAEAIHRLGARGELEHFALDETRLPSLAERVVRVSRATYPDLRAIPRHTRFRHFGVGGVDRVARLDARLAGSRPTTACARSSSWPSPASCWDAGTGERWAYREAGGDTYTRSEGLAVASYHLFDSGALSDDPRRAPHRADARALAAFTAGDLAGAFQVGPDNPLVGLEGRASIVRRLGEVVGSHPEVFGAGDAPARLGRLGVHLASQARAAKAGALPASAVLGAVLEVLGPIWPGREVCAGRNLGDVWTHPAVGRVPLHKLSQWLTYSLCEPLEESGVRITDYDELTGLVEDRNGGLFVDGGVLAPKDPRALSDTHAVGSALVVEWRALTITLLDRIAGEMRRQLGLHPDELSLAQVLEGGTWRAGRELARERRADGAPPIRVHSDGTVF